MTIQLRFRLTFESDWHISAGHGLGLQADSAIQRDPDGIPIISGATLKGLFRDALYDLKAHSVHGDTLPNMILGSPSAESVWVFNAARPVQDDQLARLKPGIDHAHITTGVRVDPFTRSAERGKLYQREMGSQNLEFSFTVEGDWFRYTEHDPVEQEAVEWLVAAARYIRRLGSRRRRGAGRCRIMLENPELQAAFLDAFEKRCRGAEPAQVKLPHRPPAYHSDSPQDYNIKNRRFRIVLRTDSPLIVAQKPESGNVFQTQAHIPGSTLRGALAERVNPGALDAADYAVFLELFVQGGIAFNDLLLLELADPAQAGYNIFASLPLGLVKNEDGHVLSTLLDEIESYEEYRNIQGYAALKDNGLDTLRQDAIQRVTQMHVHIDPDTKRAADSDLFAYDAISRGRYFVGEIMLKDHVAWSTTAALLHTNLKHPFQMNIGKGRKRGYGICTAWIEPLPDNAPSLWSQVSLKTRLEVLPDRLVVTLATDTILLDHWGRAIQSFDEAWLAEELGLPVNSFTLQDSVVRSRLVEGFDTLSGLPRWRDIALTAGSSAVLENIKFDVTKYLPDFAALERDGIGLRRNEGFGRIMFNHPWHTRLYTGFVGPIALPSALVSVRSDSDSNTRAAFIAAWQAYLAQELKPQHFLENDRLISQYRTLARRLIEQRPANAEEAKLLLTALGKPGDAGQEPYYLSQSYLNNRQKENRFKPEAVQSIIGLLEYLEQTYPTHWQRGIVMLAETLLNLEKQGERGS